MENVFFFFLSFAFILLVAENQRGCVPNDTLEKKKKPFAALIPRVKANQRRVQKKWRSVFLLFCFVFSKRKTLIIKGKNGDYFSV